VSITFKSLRKTLSNKPPEFFFNYILRANIKGLELEFAYVPFFCPIFINIVNFKPIQWNEVQGWIIIWMDYGCNWLTQWSHFVWRKNGLKQSVSMDEMDFDQWIYHYWLDEFHGWLCPKCNDMNFSGMQNDTTRWDVL
jgi:hypothetical protein